MKNYNKFILEKKIPYQKHLCPDVWTNQVLDEKIEAKLLRIARDFYVKLELDTEIIDIQLVGSLANYNYTAGSDLDVHIIIDFADVNDDTELVMKFVDDERFIWNMKHNIVIKDHDVEMYVQDHKADFSSAGIYSLLNHKWVTLPTYSPPDVDSTDIDPKYEARASDIDKLAEISERDLDPAEAEEYYKKSYNLKLKIMKARSAGLSASGEFSIENLVFKKLRNEGKLKKLIDIIVVFYDKIYSQ